MYIFENVWLKDTETKNEVINFWLNENVFSSREIAEERAKQLVYVAKNETNGKILGVCTSYILLIPQLNNNYFYYYRVYVSTEHRGHKLSRTLMIHTRELFNRMFLEDQESKIIGIFLEIENDAFKRRKKAIWEYPNFNFYFIGTNPDGTPIRVSYFDNARI